MDDIAITVRRRSITNPQRSTKSDKKPKRQGLPVNEKKMLVTKDNNQRN